jgi:hypothetical protein
VSAVVVCLSVFVLTIDLSYGLMQSMGNLGPGNMLGLTSSESYATPIRYAMAFVIDLHALTYMTEERAMVSPLPSARPVPPSVHKLSHPFRFILARSALCVILVVGCADCVFCRWTFIIAAICGITGVLVTYFFVPDMTGVDLADEDAKFFAYLRENGWEGDVGEDESVQHLTSTSEKT